MVSYLIQCWKAIATDTACRKLDVDKEWKSFLIARARTRRQKITAQIPSSSVYQQHLTEHSVTNSAFRHLVHHKQLLLVMKYYFYLVVSYSSA